jgi:hypothetical protein
MAKNQKEEGERRAAAGASRLLSSDFFHFSKNQKKEGETRQQRQQLREKKESEARRISFFGINQKKEHPLVQLNQIQVSISYYCIRP